jgi:hypothetical protein
MFGVSPIAEHFVVVFAGDDADFVSEFVQAETRAGERRAPASTCNTRAKAAAGMTGRAT